MASTIITLYPGHGTPSTIVLRDMLPVQPAAGTTIVLWPVTASTVVLRDPALIEASGGGTLTATRVVNVSTFGAARINHRLTATRYIDPDTVAGESVHQVVRPTAVVNVSTFGAPELVDTTPPVVVALPTGGHMAAQYAEIEEDDEEVFALASAYLRMAA
jgi:hypothetical protein